MKKIFVLFFVVFTSTLAWSAENVASSSLSINSKDLKVAFKGEVRHLFGQMARNLEAVDFGKMPDGIEIIDISGCKGLKITQGKMEIRVDSWVDDKGLLERFKECRELYGRNLIAAINGSFYSSRGVLGPLVSDGTLPPNLRQIPGSLSRCFVASFRATKGRQYWYIGETSIKGADLLRYSFKELAWFNVPEIYGGIDNLLGGGGWILREKHDVHRESYERQRFLFRREDQTSRHTVIAQDTDRNLYLLVFEEGQNLHQIARTLAKEPVFARVRDAFFLDGGSSSSIVLKEKYLVSPLYLVDKARFSSVQVFVLDAQW